jgi:hypothetical protein
MRERRPRAGCWICAVAGQGGRPRPGSEWDLQRRIRAQVLFQRVTGDGPALADSVVAVRLRGVLAKAEAPSLTLRGSYLRGLSACRLQGPHTQHIAQPMPTGRAAICGMPDGLVKA